MVVDPIPFELCLAPQPHLPTGVPPKPNRTNFNTGECVFATERSLECNGVGHRCCHGWCYGNHRISVRFVSFLDAGTSEEDTSGRNGTV
jgi:hypothetical protein